MQSFKQYFEEKRRIRKKSNKTPPIQSTSQGTPPVNDAFSSKRKKIHSGSVPPVQTNRSTHKKYYNDPELQQIRKKIEKERLEQARIRTAQALQSKEGQDRRDSYYKNREKYFKKRSPGTIKKVLSWMNKTSPTIKFQ